MAARPLSPREHFRQTGRDVLLVPGDRKLHEVRVMAACALDGAEPVQGAVADLMHGCLPDAEATARLLRRPQVAERLAPFVARDFLALAERRERLPRVSPLATRFSVLTMPSLDVPQRALLFSGTVRDNMRWADDTATDGEIDRALRVAQAAGSIEPCRST